MCERLASGGFVALAPDLYRGEIAHHDEMDLAAELMKKLPPERAGRDMSAAIDYLLQHPAVTSRQRRRRRLLHGRHAVVHHRHQSPRQGEGGRGVLRIPAGRERARLVEAERAKVRGHMAEHDSFFPPDKAKELEARLRAIGKDVEFTVHKGTGHAFMGPHNALGTLDVDKADEDLAGRDRVPQGERVSRSGDLVIW